MILHKKSKFVNKTITFFIENQEYETNIQPDDLINILCLAAFSSVKIDSHNNALFALWEFEYTGKSVLKPVVKYLLNMMIERIEIIKVNNKDYLDK